MTEKYYAYILYDPIKREPFYVGKGTGNRASKHRLEMAGNFNKIERINKIQEKGKEPIVKILAKDINEEAAFLLEAIAIHRIGKINEGGPLTNILSGGKNEYFSRNENDTLSVQEIDSMIALVERRYPHLMKVINRIKKPKSKEIGLTRSLEKKVRVKGNRLIVIEFIKESYPDFLAKIPTEIILPYDMEDENYAIQLCGKIKCIQLFTPKSSGNKIEDNCWTLRVLTNKVVELEIRDSKLINCLQNLLLVI